MTMVKTQFLLLSAFKNFICKLRAEIVGDIDPGEEMTTPQNELQRFALILQKKRQIEHDS